MDDARSSGAALGSLSVRRTESGNADLTILERFTADAGPAGSIEYQLADYASWAAIPEEDRPPARLGYEGRFVLLERLPADR